MTTSRTDDDCVVFECNHCEDVLETETQHWPAALETLHEHEWECEQSPDGIWVHACPNCPIVFPMPKRAG